MSASRTLHHVDFESANLLFSTLPASLSYTQMKSKRTINSISKSGRQLPDFFNQ
jgi:hypothetical protein